MNIDSRAQGQQIPTQHSSSELARLVEPRVLERLLARFSSLEHATIVLLAPTGLVIGEPVWGDALTELIAATPEGRDEFTRAAINAATDEAERTDPFRTDTLVLHAASIRRNHRHIGTVVVGMPHDSTPDEATLELTARSHHVEPSAVLQAAAQSSLESIGKRSGTVLAKLIADILSILCEQSGHIAEQTDDLHTVYGITEAFSGNYDLQKVLDRTVKRVVDAMNVKACGIRLLNEETGELIIKSVHNLSDEYLGKGRVLLRENPIDAAAFGGETVYIENAATDPRIRFPCNAQQEGIVSGLCVPMTYAGKTVGVMRVYTATRRSFTESQRTLLRLIASHAASGIINNFLFEEQAKAEYTQRQVIAAAAIQRRMLPAEAPKHPGLDIGCAYAPTLELGGDFYDFLKFPDGTLGVCVADVVGKGLPAALLMSSVRSALRIHAHDGIGISDILARVNDHMSRDTLPSEFATLCYGTFSPDGGSFTYCNAGHLPPLLLRDGTFTALNAGGLVIGIQPGETYESQKYELKTGDVLVLTTDGTIEALNFQDEAYGQDRLEASIIKHAKLDGYHIAQQILWDVRRFAGLAPQSDDITIVVVKIQ